MPYLRINPDYVQRYSSGRSIYVGPTTPIRYGVMSTRVDPDTGEIMLTGYREEQGVFPVLPGFFLAWIFKGIWNWLTGKLLSIFGVKPEENPFRLDFHMGCMDRSYLPSRYGGNGYRNGYGRNNGNGNSVPKHYINNGWENGLARELYRFD